ncbi:MAG: hypothetical protein LBU64_00130 [Planctomycetota bacterium]|jgi:hypothetical protein|nr:hypothetical protein [Planctomycetota bacterium]
MERRRPVRLALLAALLICPGWIPSRRGAGAADPGADYSGAGGGGASRIVRLAPARPVALIPKTLAGLRGLTGEDFLCVERGDCLVASDLGPGEYEYLVDGVLDYCHDALRRAFFDRGRGAGKKLSVFVFRDYASYESGLARFMGMAPISPYGHYGHSQKYIVVNYETGPGTLVHELTHSLMSEDFPEAPIWLAEGMASLYEQCRAEGEFLRGDDNWRLPELKDALAAGRLEPLSGLLAMAPSEFRGGRESLNYAAARYFCKYLEEMGSLPEVYKEFRRRPELDPTGRGFVVRALGKPLEAVDAEWRRWLRFQYWRE